MDAWDKRFQQASSLLPIIKVNAKSSVTAEKYTQKSQQEFVTLVNTLLEELKQATWHLDAIQYRWRLLEPLLGETDRIHPPTPIPALISLSKKPSSRIEDTNFSSEPKSVPQQLNRQFDIMEAQDAALFSLSDSVQSLKERAKLISQESRSQSELISNLTVQLDSVNAKTDASLSKVKKL